MLDSGSDKKLTESTQTYWSRAELSNPMIRRMRGVQYVCLDSIRFQSKSGKVSKWHPAGTDSDTVLAGIDRMPTLRGLICENVGESG